MMIMMVENCDDLFWLGKFENYWRKIEFVKKGGKDLIFCLIQVPNTLDLH